MKVFSYRYEERAWLRKTLAMNGCENICEQSWDSALPKFIQFLHLHGQKYQRSNAITESIIFSYVILKAQLVFAFMHCNPSCKTFQAQGLKTIPAPINLCFMHKTSGKRLINTKTVRLYRLNQYAVGMGTSANWYWHFHKHHDAEF